MASPLKTFIKTTMFNPAVMNAFEKKVLSMTSDEFRLYILDLIKKKSDLLLPEESAKMVMNLDSKLYEFEGVLARKYGEGVHLKHKHIKYHDFFTQNLDKGENVLDIGSSNGELASDIAKKVNPGKVFGIEIEEWHVQEAQKLNIPNLKIIQGDATKESNLPKESFDAITLSNVLEHIEDRPGLLKLLVNKYHPKKVLIRVPAFQRDWRVPFKKELGLDYRLDDTHFIEYTKEEFEKEMSEAGLQIKEFNSIWGEFWVVLKSVK